MASHSMVAGLQTALIEPNFLTPEDPAERYDVTIKFLSAKDLPKMDVVGASDPYFLARIDDHVTYKSSTIPNSLSPVWKDEEWTVRNIPRTAKLFVVVFDRDIKGNADDFIGQFEVPDLINYQAPPDGHEVLTSKKVRHGYFFLAIEATQSSEESKRLPKYTFDGPCRYTRNDLASVGRLAKVNDERVYTTWAVTMRRVPMFFTPADSQYWDQGYKPGQKIFGPNPLTVFWRETIKATHKTLFETTLHYTESGRINSADDIWRLMFFDKNGKRLRPCLYTYIIDDCTWRFSETRDEGFTHFISKHAVLVNGMEYVRFAGELHPRPKGGWDKPEGEWELVFDNGSGTYAPTTDLLAKLNELLSFNFPGLNFVTVDFADPDVKESKKQMEKEYGYSKK